MIFLLLLFYLISVIALCFWLQKAHFEVSEFVLHLPSWGTDHLTARRGRNLLPAARVLIASPEPARSQHETSTLGASSTCRTWLRPEQDRLLPRGSYFGVKAFVAGMFGGLGSAPGGGQAFMSEGLAAGASQCSSRRNPVSPYLQQQMF